MSTKTPMFRKSTSVTAPRPDRGEVVIDLDADAIRKRAFELSTQKKSYDDLIWLLAESDLRLRDAYMKGAGVPGKSIVVNRATIVGNPDVASIKRLATELASKRPKVQDMHWCIAENQFISEAARSR
jgi:hypothetical protein